MAAMLGLTNRLGRGAVCAIALASITLAASASGATTTTNAPAPRYDGIWSVLIVTERGDCDRGYRYPIRITNGMLVNGGNDPFTITGKVMPTGAITVTVSHGDKSASGSGRLAGNAGEGSWSGGSCSGTWTAERRS